MQLEADGRDIAGAIDMMLQSNLEAARLALAHGASAATDITGFGLVGHLLEMLSPDQGARLELRAVPLLPGAATASKSGLRSTLYPDNYRACERYLANGVPDDPAAALLFDPQTCGGLLATLPAASVDDVLAAFASANEPIWKIGDITPGDPHILVQ